MRNIKFVDLVYNIMHREIDRIKGSTPINIVVVTNISTIVWKLTDNIDDFIDRLNNYEV